MTLPRQTDHWTKHDLADFWHWLRLPGPPPPPGEVAFAAWPGQPEDEITLANIVRRYRIRLNRRLMNWWAFLVSEAGARQLERQELMITEEE